MCPRKNNCFYSTNTTCKLYNFNLKLILIFKCPYVFCALSMCHHFITWQNKQILLMTTNLAASASALKLCTPGDANYIYYQNIHTLNQRGTPNQYILYKHDLRRNRGLNDMVPVNDWIALNFMQSLTSRQTKFRAMRSNNFKAGPNLLSNQLCMLNGKI